MKSDSRFVFAPSVKVSPTRTANHLRLRQIRAQLKQALSPTRRRKTSVQGHG